MSETENEDTYFDEWSETSPIEWWNEGRKKLNVLIRMANDWTLNGKPEEEKTMMLRKIDMGKQTFAKQEENGGWWEELEKIEKYVREAN
jgi:hypothetical protein